MSNIVLVHGAWHGAWCWHKVVPELRHLGHRVVAVDLPGHGIDRTPIEAVTLEAYADRVGEALAAFHGPAVLVGHSMGGVVITEAAERFCEQVAGLIYLTAIVLQPGESMLDNPVKASPPEFMAGFRQTADGTGIDYDRALIRPSFYADCSDADVALAELCLVTQPARVMQEPLSSTDARWGRIPRAYITCADDQALTLDGQRGMIERVGMNRVVDMPGSHSPFFAQPQALARHMEALRDFLEREASK